MARKYLLDALNDRTLLCDGAMGTQLFLRGLAPGTSGEHWNVEKPHLVEDIHRAYRSAGCDLITTNTFGASAPALERHGLSKDVYVLNVAGAKAARRVAGDDAWVLGDIGPFGGFLEPLGDTTPDQLLEIFTAQAKALKEGGADAAIIETMSDPNEMAVAIRAARQVGDWPIIATYSFDRGNGQEFRTMMGAYVADAVAEAIKAGADIVGANCGTSLSLQDYQRLAEELVAAAGNVPVILQPNAGSPQEVNGKLVYGATPADMAAIVPSLKEIGVKIIGGCCGTSPDHLAAMGKVVNA